MEGSIEVDYTVVANADIVHRNQTDVNQFLQSSFNDDRWLNISEDYGKLNLTLTRTKNHEYLERVITSLNDTCKLTENPCDVAHNCSEGKCISKCAKFHCGSHGECHYDYEKHVPYCRCKQLYSGSSCDQNTVLKTEYDKDKSDYDKEKLLIIEIAGGAGGGVILFLLIVLVCVCINLRKKDQKERDTEYPDEESLKRSDNFHAPYTNEGKSNPLFNGGIEGDRYVSTPRSSEDMGVPDARGSTRREEMEMEEMNRYDKMNGLRKEPERNMVRREDGRVYHVINDEEIGNNTFLYRPSTRETEELSWSRAPNNYTDQGNMEVKKPSYYDRISTDTEYKINRPRVNTRQTYYK